MQSATADFTASGGAVLLLFTSTPETLPFYEQLGFRQLYCKPVLHEMDWAMWHPAGSQTVVTGLFGPSAVRVRRLTAGDLAMYCLLYNLEYQTRLKDWAQPIGTGLETEWTFITLMERIRSGQAVCWVAENDQTIVGIASLVRCGFAHQSHLAAIDCYTHAAFAETGQRLVEACLAGRGELGVEIVYALAADESKRREFSALAFTERAHLPGHYKIENQRDDCWLFEVE
jgi:N-acetylglutamate synthase-like GNAT family acetyltransferase